MWAIITGHLYLAVAVVGFAGVTDWLDGYTARVFKASGAFGLIFDPLADKILLVFLFAALTYAGLIPVWFLALAFGRDLVIVTGALLLRIYRGVRRFPPKILGKVSTFFQIVYALLSLLRAAFAVKVFLWLDLLALCLAAVFTAASGLDYVLVGIKLAKAGGYAAERR